MDDRLRWNALPKYVPSASSQINKYHAYGQNYDRPNIVKSVETGDRVTLKKSLHGLYEEQIKRLKEIQRTPSSRFLPAPTLFMTPKYRGPGDLPVGAKDWRLRMSRVDPTLSVYWDGDRSFPFTIFLNIRACIIRHALLHIPYLSPLLIQEPPLLRFTGLVSEEWGASHESMYGSNGLSIHVTSDDARTFVNEMQVWLVNDPPADGLIPVNVHIPGHALLVMLDKTNRSLEIWDSGRHAKGWKVRMLIHETICRLEPALNDFKHNDYSKESYPFGHATLNPRSLYLASVPFMLMIRKMNASVHPSMVALYFNHGQTVNDFLFYIAYARDLFYEDGPSLTRRFYENAKRDGVPAEIAQQLFTKYAFAFVNLSEKEDIHWNLDKWKLLNSSKLILSRYDLKWHKLPTLDERAALNTPSKVYNYIRTVERR